MDLFRWSTGTFVLAMIISFVLRFATTNPWVLFAVEIIIGLFAVVYGIRKYGSFETAFTAGGAIAIAPIAGMLAAQTLENDIAALAVILALLGIIYVVGGFIARFTLAKPQ